jgi:hypothetical protein
MAELGQFALEPISKPLSWDTVLSSATQTRRAAKIPAQECRGTAELAA